MNSKQSDRVISLTMYKYGGNLFLTIFDRSSDLLLHKSLPQKFHHTAKM